MSQKALLDQAIQRYLLYGRLRVTYWDGDTRRYGDTGPEVKIRLRDPKFALRLARNASLAVGEGYTEGSLEVPENQLADLFEIINRQPRNPGWRQPKTRSKNVLSRQRSQISHHYDVGNDYYDLFLDKATRTYSCAYFQNDSDSLEAAQQQKIQHVLRKLRPEKGQRVLDIGCGWGYLAVAAAKHYGMKATGITLSEEQLKGAQALARRERVARLVDFRLANYQDLAGDSECAQAFDRVVSVGMFEHVGKGNHAGYFRAVDRLLKDGGVSVLHTITQRTDRPTDAWVDKYIFPGGYLPRVSAIEALIESAGFWSIDRENLWQHYARTLAEWRRRHQANKKKIVTMFDKEFYRMRDFWLAGSEAGFRHGQLGLGQFIFTKEKPDEWPLTRRYTLE